MADAHLLRSLDVAALEAEAAIRRDEDEAADDLALSLRQGAGFRDTLRRWGSFEVSFGDGRYLPAQELGLDYVGVRGDGPILVPLGTISAARSSPGTPVRIRDRDMIWLLRAAARRGTLVEIEPPVAGGQRARGRLLQACPDHVVLRVGGTETAHGLAAVGLVRLLEEADAHPGSGT